MKDQNRALTAPAERDHLSLMKRSDFRSRSLAVINLLTLPLSVPRRSPIPQGEDAGERCVMNPIRAE